MIKLDVAAYGNHCDACPARNYSTEQFPVIPAMIYALSIGVGYRQPSYLCPDCLAKVRALLGVRIGTTPCDRGTVEMLEAMREDDA